MANHRLPEGQSYAGRREDVAVTTVNIPREARELLRQWAPTTPGAMLARLIYEHQVRLEERAKLQHA